MTITNKPPSHALLIFTACLIGLFATVGAALPYPILPPLFAADAPNNLNHFLGLHPKLLFGLALAINPVGLLIGSALLGPLSDRYGRRPVLVITALGAALGHALTAWALILQSYPLLIVARFATGLMEGNGSVARAMLAETLQGEQRARAMSWLNGAFYLGWLAGPLLAGVTLHWGITTPFWVAVTVLTGTAVLSAVAVPRRSGPPLASAWWHVVRHQHSLKLLTHPELRTLFIVHLAYTCGVNAFYEFYPLWLVEQWQFDARAIAWTTAALCAVMTAASLITGRPSASEPRLRAAHFGLLAALCVAAVGLGTPPVGLIAIVAFGVPNAYYNAIMPTWCAERFGHLGQGAVMGLLGTTFCFANIFMAVVGAGLTLIDTRLILLVGAGLSAWAAWRLRRWGQVNGASATAIQSTP